MQIPNDVLDEVEQAIGEVVNNARLDYQTHFGETIHENDEMLVRVKHIYHAQSALDRLRDAREGK